MSIIDELVVTLEGRLALESGESTKNRSLFLISCMVEAFDTASRSSTDFADLEQFYLLIDVKSSDQRYSQFAETIYSVQIPLLEIYFLSIISFFLTDR